MFFKTTTLCVLVFSVFAQGCGDTERLSGVVEKTSISGDVSTKYNLEAFVDLTIKDKVGDQSILVKVPFQMNLQTMKKQAHRGGLIFLDALQEKFEGQPVVCSVSGTELERFKNSEIASVSGRCAQNGTDVEKWLIQERLAVSRKQ